MSELKVDKITPRQGTTLTLGDSGDTINFGSGVLPNFENLTVTGDLTVDTNSLKVDSTNNFVGIGTASPSTTLHLAQSLPQIRLEDTDTGAYGTISGQSTAGSLFIRADDGNTVANSVLGFSVDNDQKMTITSSGNVGIGTTSPNMPLEIYSSIPYIRLTDSVAPTGYSELRGTHLGALVFSADASNSVAGSYQAFEVDGSERMRINSSGNVGIGTSSPDDRLHVNSGTQNDVAKFESTDTTASLILVDSATTTDGNRIQTIGDTMNFQTAGSEAMRITSSGNVGIGEISPLGKVHINTGGSATTINTNGDDLILETNANTGMSIIASNTGDASIFFRDPDDTNIGAIQYNNTSDYMLFRTNDTERMRIDSSGNVLIGATSTASSNYGAKFLKDDSTSEILAIHRQASDGDFIQFTRGGSDSGNIKHSGGNLVINAVNDFEIQTNDGTDVVHVGSNGNVGIGETSPLGKVHIKSADSGISSVSGGANELVLENSGDTGMTISSGTTASCLINFADSGSNSIGGFDYNHADNGLRIRTNGSEAMRIDSSRNLLVGRTNNPSGVSNCIYALGNYGITTGSGANVFINSEGLFFRSTSSLRYKNTINDATHGLTELLTLRPVTYKGNNDGNKIFGGLIAEEVHDAGLTEFVQYNDDGQPDALHYGNMVSLCIKAIQELKADNDALRTRIEALENA